MKISSFSSAVLFSFSALVASQDETVDYGALSSVDFEFDESLESCQTFANLFSTTCGVDSDPPSLSDMISAEFSCAGVGKCGSTSDYDAATDTCTWQRKLCVTCTSTRNQVYIRVQTNGMPMHCYVASKKGPEEINLDFEVAWNWDVGSNIYQEVNSQSQQNNLMCEGLEEPDDDSGYVQIGADTMENAGGVAFDGVVMQTSTFEEGVDIIFPTYYGPIETYNELLSYTFEFDKCGGFVSQDNVYYYTTTPLCLLDPTLHYNNELMDSSESIVHLSFEAESAHNDVSAYYPYPIGIAKDGHIIWGPYNENGVKYDDCDVDVCNGIFKNGYYGYVTTDFHPYNVGCFGPGDASTYESQCSADPRSCQGDNGWIQSEDVFWSSGATLISLSTLAGISMFVN